MMDKTNEHSKAAGDSETTELANDLFGGKVDQSMTRAGTRGGDDSSTGEYFKVEDSGLAGTVLILLTPVEALPQAPTGLPTGDVGTRGPDTAAPPASAVLMSQKLQVEDPPINWRGPIPNMTSGRFGHQPVAICDHIMAGSLGSADSWFHNADAEASAHFGIGRGGEIYQWVNTGDMAWGNGLGFEDDGRPYIDTQKGRVYENPDRSVPWLKQAIDQRVNPNLLTVSIEHDGQTGQAFTEEEYKATLWLHKFLIKKFNIPVLPQHIIGHVQITPRNRPTCPGTGFDKARLMKDLQQWAGAIELIQVSYKASVTTTATVRQGPGRSYNAVATKKPGAERTFDVTGEAHGETIRDERRNRDDNVWCFFRDLDGASGFVTRTALDW